MSRHRHPSSHSPGRRAEPAASASSRGSGGGAGIHLFGLHAVTEAWLNPRRRCHRLLLTAAAQKSFAGSLQQAAQQGLKRPVPELADGRQLDRLTEGGVHQGVVLACDPLPETSLEDLLAALPPQACLLVLDQVTDPHNVGAMLRSACALGADAVLVTERHAASATGTLAKVASGALEHLPLVRLGNLAQSLGALQKANVWCIGLDESGTRILAQIKMPARVALVMGAEGDGLRRLTRENCDELARLPTKPPIGALNVSNAAAVSIYEVLRQRGA